MATIMKSINHGYNPFVKTAICIALSGGMLAIAPAARADAISDLKAQIEALQKKVDELATKQAAAAKAPPAPANVVTGGATPGSFKLPGSDTSVTFGGYVKGDAIVSSKSAGVNSVADQALFPGLIPLTGANEKKQLTLHARQSRFNIKTDTPTAMGALSTFLEFDLFGTSGDESAGNSHNLRLRHAFGSLGGLLVGQTWSNFMDPGALPETLDFGGSVGSMFVRQAQIRWTQAFDGGKWSVSLENPESIVALSPLPDKPTFFRADDDRIPDITGKIDFNTAKGRYSITGMARQIRLDSAGTPVGTPVAIANKWGGVIGFNGVIPTTGKDDFRFTLNYGNAIGRYSGNGTTFRDGVLDANSNLDLPNQWAAIASYRHFWTGNLRSTVALSGLGVSNPSTADGKLIKNARSAHLNLIWSPVAKTDLGIEYIHARREIQNGQSGSLNRLQASAQYAF
jgi:hypothetical protein